MIRLCERCEDVCTVYSDHVKSYCVDCGVFLALGGSFEEHLDRMEECPNLYSDCKLICVVCNWNWILEYEYENDKEALIHDSGCVQGVQTPSFT